MTSQDAVSERLSVNADENQNTKPSKLHFLLLAFILLASLVPSLLSRQLPGIGDVERLLHDIYRSALAPEVGLDPDIAILHYDDAAAHDSGKTSPVDRQLLANAIVAADQGGARAIGLDFFFAQKTDDEAALVDALNSISTPVYIIYADPNADREVFWSAEIDSQSRSYQEQFWSRIASIDPVKTSPLIGTDSSETARRWPTRGPDMQPAFAGAIAGVDGGYEGSIAFTKLAVKRPDTKDTFSAGMFPTYSLSGFVEPDTAQILGANLADRYVLIGLDIFNADRFATPVSRILGEGKMPGVTVHAHMLRQALNGDFPPALTLWQVGLVGLLFGVCGMAVGLLDRKQAMFAVGIVSVVAIWAALPLMARFVGLDLLSLPMAGWLVSFAITLTGFSYLTGAKTSRQKAFAQGALGLYLSADVAREIIDDPGKLSLEGEERELFMLFTDLEGFTRISHAQPPRTTARILNRYLDEMSDVILAHGGTIDKFVGDAIVAFWGAPLAGEDDANQSVQCALALHDCAERLRSDLADRGDTLGRTRIGLHNGPVVVGNFGGKQRIQYTALGDAMNTAARLEGANKFLGTDILVSAAIRKLAPDFAYRPMGEIVLSGVNQPLAVFEPVQDVRASYADAIRDAIAALEAGDSDAVDRLRGLHEIHVQDRALARLIERADVICGGKPYVLESK